MEKRKGEKYELDQKTFAAFDVNGDGNVSIAEFVTGLHPKTRSKLEEKVLAGWKFDGAAWTDSVERHKKWDMSKVFKQVRGCLCPVWCFAGIQICRPSLHYPMPDGSPLPPRAHRAAHL